VNVLTAVGRSVGRRRASPARRRRGNGDDADVAGSHGRLRGRDGGVEDGEHVAARAASHVAVSRRLRKPSQDAVIAVESHVRAERV